MSWVKRNLYFVISGAVAVALLIAAGWYSYSAWSSNDANWQKLSEDYTQLQTLSTQPGAGATNLDLVKSETKEVQDRVAQMEKWFEPIPSIPNTNHLGDQILASAVRQTVGALRTAAAAHSVVLPTDFNFSFTLQEGRIQYDPNSWDHLAKQLGEVKAICEVLFGSRVATLDAVQRERTADDVSTAGGAVSSLPEYIDSTSVTNNNIVITPYQVTFQCFTPELGAVLSSFANQPHTFVVKTLNIAPQDAMPGMGEPGNYGGYGGGAGGYGAGAYGGNTPVPQRAGPAVTVIDEKRLKVILQVDVVKKLPAPGR